MKVSSVRSPSTNTATSPVPSACGRSPTVKWPRSARCRRRMSTRSRRRWGIDRQTVEVKKGARERAPFCLSESISMTAPTTPDHIELAPGLAISRVVTGLWQVADMERGGKPLDLDRAAAALGDYASAGFDAFDMADHYGSAEDIAGRFNEGVAGGRFKPAAVFTKWCPTPG